MIAPPKGNCTNTRQSEFVLFILYDSCKSISKKYLHYAFEL